MEEYFILAAELAGTIAFSVSGALTAIRKKMDLLGVMILGLCTATGGGIIRDLILGYTPPAAFRNPVYSIVALLTAVIIFLPPVTKSIQKNQKNFDRVLLAFDTIGLGIFTVTGIEASHTESSANGVYLFIFVGVVTGVGGGVLRDIFAGTKPAIFVEHIYATASILGAVVCVALWNFAGQYIAMIAGAVIIALTRVLAAHYRWNLPRAEYSSQNGDDK